MPNKSNIVIFCGFIGMVTGLSGMFIDSILGVSTENKKENISNLENKIYYIFFLTKFYQNFIYYYKGVI